jgi:hypothetical protein
MWTGGGGLLSLAGIVIYFFFFHVAQAGLEQILTNKRIWGKAFPVIIAQADLWANMGDGKLTLDRHEAYEEGIFSEKGDVLTSQFRFEELVKSFSVDPSAHVSKLQRFFEKYSKDRSLPGNLTQAILVQLPQIKRSGEEMRITESNPDGELLASDLTPSVILKELGKPEKVTEKIIRPKFEGMSETQRVWSYAAESVQFIDSNYSAALPGSEERLIQKAILDSRKVAATLNQSAK